MERLEPFSIKALFFKADRRYRIYSKGRLKELDFYKIVFYEPMAPYLASLIEFMMIEFVLLCSSSNLEFYAVFYTGSSISRS